MHGDFQFFKDELKGVAQKRLHFEAAGTLDFPLVVRVGHRRSSFSTQCGVVVLYAGPVGITAPMPKLRGVLKVLKSAKMLQLRELLCSSQIFGRRCLELRDGIVAGKCP